MERHKLLLFLIFVIIGGSNTPSPPLSPAELLVALHTIESKSDVKAIMKGSNLIYLYLPWHVIVNYIIHIKYVFNRTDMYILLHTLTFQ